MSQAVTLDPSAAQADAAATYRKVAWRLMPFVLLCYVANYIDRTNIGIAQLQLRTDLGFSEAVYGVGVGLFFVGFILFEVPSNMLLERIGARRTLLRIMVSWGAVSTLTMFVRTLWQFYAARVLLSMAEAGFFPGMTVLHGSTGAPTNASCSACSREADVFGTSEFEHAVQSADGDAHLGCAAPIGA